MATAITKRATKGSALTITEMDTNLQNLVDAVDSVTAKTENTKSSIRPSLLLDFANLKRLDKRITFTRASIGTRYNADGLLERVEAGKPRFDHNPVTKESLGLLIEEQRTNLLTYSENFDNAAWLKSGATVTANSTTAPDGTLTADKMVENTALNPHYIVETLTLANGAYSASVYVKAAERNICFVGMSDGVTALSGAFFNVATETVTISSGGSWTAATAEMKSVGNGWYRCIVSGTRNAGTVTTAQIYTALTSSTVTHTGDGTSGIYIWGAQLEVGAFATSYISSNDTFTSRASTATYIGSDGLVKTAAINTARYNYNPMNLKLAPKLLLEPAATNLLTYSEQFDNAAWIKNNATVTANAATAPDGTTTADKVFENTASSTHYLVANLSGLTASAYYTYSVYVKAGERTRFDLGSWDGTLGIDCIFNLSTGTVDITGSGSIPSIINAGNGWYRCSVTRPIASTTLQVIIYTDSATSGAGANNYIGNGTSGIYVWGAQLEVGTTATSYIPTTSSQVTRSADVSSSGQYTRLADSAEMLTSTWFNKDEGSFLTALSNVSNPAGSIVMVDKGLNSWGGRIQMSMNSSLTVVQTNIVNDAGGVDVQLGNTGLKTVFAYKTNDCANSANGSITATDSSATLPTSLTKMHIGKSPASNYILDGTLAKLAYYPKRLSNAELQSLTGG
jgi:hypothetical protein